MTRSLPPCANSGHSAATGVSRPMPSAARACSRQLAARPFVMDHRSTSVSARQGVLCWRSRHPALNAIVSLPSCQIETEAPSSPRRAKFTSKRVRTAGRSMERCISVAVNVRWESGSRKGEKAVKCQRWRGLSIVGPPRNHRPPTHSPSGGSDAGDGTQDTGGRNLNAETRRNTQRRGAEVKRTKEGGVAQSVSAGARRPRNLLPPPPSCPLSPAPVSVSLRPPPRLCVKLPPSCLPASHLPHRCLHSASRYHSLALAAIPSSVVTICGVRVSFAAARFSRRCPTDDVPGISRIFGDRCSSHASATCIGVASE